MAKKKSGSSNPMHSCKPLITDSRGHLPAWKNPKKK